MKSKSKTGPVKGSKSFKALVEETAVARGQTPSEAMRQALQEWVHRPSQAA